MIGSSKLLVSALAVSLLALVPAAPAAASCLMPPQESSNKFTGTVVDTANHDRTATVRTDDGKTVTVNGSEGAPGSFTSVDRTYEKGARYEFHPINDADPYQDNACTATHVIDPATTADGEQPVSSDGDQPVSSDDGGSAATDGGAGDDAIGLAGAEAESDGEDGVALGWVAFGAIVGAAAVTFGFVTMRRRAKP